MKFASGDLSTERSSRKIVDNIEIVFLCMAALWIVYLSNLFLPFDLRAYGIRPRTVSGLAGIFFAPFLHAGLGHLFSNSLALAPLLLISLSCSRVMTLEVVILIAVLGGGATWLIGTPNTIHIGASGIIFGLIGYLLAFGIFRRELLAFAVSIVVASYYGWALFSLFMVIPGVSWASHFFGFGAGIAVAWLTRNEKWRSEGAGQR